MGWKKKTVRFVKFFFYFRQQKNIEKFFSAIFFFRLINYRYEFFNLPKNTIDSKQEISFLIWDKNFRGFDHGGITKGVDGKDGNPGNPCLDS